MSTKVKDMVHGKLTGEHEDMNDVIHGWDKREAEIRAEQEKLRKKSHRKGQVRMVLHKQDDKPLPHELDPNFRYGMSTHDIDVRADPFLRSNAKIEQRREAQEAAAEKKVEKKKPKKFVDLSQKPTAASIGHTHKAPPEPALKDTFKMKRFTQIEHGKIDTGLRK